MSLTLRKHSVFPGRPGPVIVLVLDGVGIGQRDESDAVWLARTPQLDRLQKLGLYTALQAHGKAVGLPSDADMGNSEVGHNALGCGRVYDQGARLVNDALASGRLFSGPVWDKLVVGCLAHDRALHFIGLLSDGNVHSHVDHLFALLREAARRGVKKIFVHPLWDGRDVPPTSALEYLDRLEPVLAATGACIASGGGRMRVTMDRYQADWEMVARGYRAHVHGDARAFASAREAVLTARAESPGILDQDLPAFVIAEGGKPVGPIVDGDSVVFFNFRGDRAIEITRALSEGPSFSAFVRGRVPEIEYAGMMQYDGDLRLPRQFLVDPPAIERTMGEYLVHSQVAQLAISETQKYGHVTYFWNGNRSGKLDERLETYIEVPSYQEPFAERPWMRAAEITDRLLGELGEERFVRMNFANGDMVGHTGQRDATISAVEAMDIQVGRLARYVERRQGVLVVTADHGNADEMYQHDQRGHIQRDRSTGAPVVKTSHTLNPVPFIIYDPSARGEYRLASETEGAQGAALGIARVTATCVELLGFAPPDDQEPSLLRFT